jgi:UDP-N-acetylmuramoyl-L-alanine---L-glutamate ligase
VRFSELKGAKVGVWGAGREIRSFAAQLHRRVPSAQLAVIAVDDPASPDLREALAAPGALVASGGDIVSSLATCDVVVRSPGVSIYRDELRELGGLGVPVTTATSLWLAEVGGVGVIGVTGTKGKSTTSTLAVHLARAVGVNAELAGNIGVPALDLLDGPGTSLSVVELSSYQIADLEIGPQVAVVTNVHREHLDWHGSEERYYSDKLRILGLAGVRAMVLNGRDDRLLKAAESAIEHAAEEDMIKQPADDAIEPRLYGVPEGWDVTDEGIAFGGSVVVASGELPLRGEHNGLNLCAALTAIEAMGLRRPLLPEALEGVKALPHRLEVVAEEDGIRWVDDSISTTPESTLAALSSFPECEIVLIAGGQDRDQDYSALGRALAERGAVVVGLPDTGSRLIAAAHEAGLSEDRAIEVEDMESAVLRARAFAEARTETRTGPGTQTGPGSPREPGSRTGMGTTVLLSPAAPSYNAYLNFEERARHFRALL